MVNIDIDSKSSAIIGIAICGVVSFAIWAIHDLISTGKMNVPEILAKIK